MRLLFVECNTYLRLVSGKRDIYQIVMVMSNNEATFEVVSFCKYMLVWIAVQTAAHKSVDENL